MSIFRSFAGGEISPSMYARVDLVKYQSSARQLRNFVSQRHGGVTMRAGTEHCGVAKTQSRLIPFISSDNSYDIYALEFGEHYIRFYQDGALKESPLVGLWTSGSGFGAGNVVLYGGFHFYCKLTHTSSSANTPGAGSAWQTYWYQMDGVILEVYTPYAAEDIAAIRYSQVGNTLTLTHALYPVYELTRLSRGPTSGAGVTGPDQWTMLPAAFGPSLNQPIGVGVTGGAAGNATYWAVTAVDEITGEESMPGIFGSTAHTPAVGTPTTVTWAYVPGATRYNIYRSSDGVTYNFIGSASGQVPGEGSSNLVWLDAVAITVSTVNGDWFADPAQAASQMVLTDPVNKSKNGRYTVHGVIYVSATNLSSDPLTTDGRVRAYYSRDGEPRQDAGVIVTLGTLIGDGNMGALAFDGVVVVPDTGYNTLRIDLVPEVKGTATGPAFSCSCTIDERAVNAPYDRITWSGGAVSFLDTATAADNTQNPPTDPGYFRNQGDYPSCVTQYQQRRVFGNSVNNTGRVWASRTGSPRNFTRSSPLTANAPVVFDMDGNKAVIIKHMLDLGRLITLNSSDEKVIEGEVQSGILKPDTINVRRYSANGAGLLPPIVVGEAALYLQARGNQVRMLRPGTNTPTSADLTVLASHLFRGRTVVDWDYAKTPDSILWAVRSDGTLLGLTFVEDEDVWGWHRHDTDGRFESVCVLPEGNEDRIYVIVNRILNGVEVRCVERMAVQAVKGVSDVRDAHYMDAGILAWDGRNTNADNTMLFTALPGTVIVGEDGSIVEMDPSGDTLYTEGSLLATLIDVVSVSATFAASDVGRMLLLISAAGDRIYFIVTAFVSSTNIQGYGEQTMPDSLLGVDVADWAWCAGGVGGLSHLLGEYVSILADGMVLSSPNNPEYPSIQIDATSTITFDHPYSVVRVGLPFVADFETLDIDIAPATIKTKKRVVSRVIAYFENSADVYVGQSDQPTADNLVKNLEILKLRDGEAYTAPLSLLTDDRDIVPISSHNTNGRVFIRQLDPLPTTILMVAPTFAEE